jgi:hypothetical protein
MKERMIISSKAFWRGPFALSVATQMKIQGGVMKLALAIALIFPATAHAAFFNCRRFQGRDSTNF